MRAHAQQRLKPLPRRRHAAAVGLLGNGRRHQREQRRLGRRTQGTARGGRRGAGRVAAEQRAVAAHPQLARLLRCRHVVLRCRLAQPPLDGARRAAQPRTARPIEGERERRARLAPRRAQQQRLPHRHRRRHAPRAPRARPLLCARSHRLLLRRRLQRGAAREAPAPRLGLRHGPLAFLLQRPARPRRRRACRQQPKQRPVLPLGRCRKRLGRLGRLGRLVPYRRRRRRRRRPLGLLTTAQLRHRRAIILCCRGGGAARFPRTPLAPPRQQRPQPLRRAVRERVRQQPPPRRRVKQRRLARRLRARCRRRAHHCLGRRRALAAQLRAQLPSRRVGRAHQLEREAERPPPLARTQGTPSHRRVDGVAVRRLHEVRVRVRVGVGVRGGVRVRARGRGRARVRVRVRSCLHEAEGLGEPL